MDSVANMRGEECLEPGKYKSGKGARSDRSNGESVLVVR